MQFITFISLIVLASSSGWTPSCTSDEAEFDFYAARPQKFAFGTRDEVAQAYERLVDNVGNPEWYSKPTLFYVTGAYTQFTKAECAGDKCDAMDVFNGLQQCSSGAQASADTCYPIAAVYNSKLYCLLEPSREGTNSSEPFHPYE
ncbi:hypothetical protein ACFVTJ_13030 [Agrobacterium sp. NPDC058088]|uniref:hypothetical protein n=1 Tax=Agrobacterium sp. NPDC058088 TaxID=3346335 RepID=UPI0036D7DCB8